MASQPPGVPPESIILDQFKGIKNTVNPERLGPGELETAENVDIDDAGQLRRRRGYTRRADGSYHSFFKSTRGALGVKDGEIGILRPDYSFHGLSVMVGADPVAYVDVGPETYFSSGNQSGVIAADNTVGPWGTEDKSRKWVSPVKSPSPTLGAVAGRLLGAPPNATSLAYYNGRIYLGEERLLWTTELYGYHLVDVNRNFVYFEAPITMLGAVDDGIYVGTTEGLWFLGGDKYPLKRQPIFDAAVLPGSMLTVPVELMHPEARQQPFAAGMGLMFLTTSGLCGAFNSGQVFNLTQNEVIFPSASTVAALFRQQDGINQYIGVADSGGTPSGNMRIGDYVDAEIRRFQG